MLFPGFAAYMGMLEVDATHNHPVLKGFIYILKTEVKDSKERHQGEGNNGDAEKGRDTTKEVSYTINILFI